jgi:hypothetical protein
MSALLFLEQSQRAFYEKVISLCGELEECSNMKVVIFGGFVRDLINGEIDRNRDVDLWFFPEENYISQTKWKRKLTSIQDKMIALNHVYENPPRISQENYNPDVGIHYCQYKRIIDGIKFDFCTDINNSAMFKDISDFSVNNLYMSLNGEIKTRCDTEFDVNDVIKHIKEKKLYDISNRSVLITYVEEYGGNVEYDVENGHRHRKVDPHKWLLKKINERQQKFVNRGYIIA